MIYHDKPIDPGIRSGKSDIWVLFFSISFVLSLNALSLYLLVSAKHQAISLLISYSSIFLFSMFLFFLFLSKNPFPTATILCIYMIFFYLLPGLIHETSLRFPFFNMTYRDDNILVSSLIILLFSIGFTLGFILSPKQIYHYELNRPPHTFRRINSKNAAASILVFSAISVIASAAIGFSLLQATRGELNNLNVILSPVDLILLTLARIGGFLAFFYSLMLWKNEKKIFPLLIVLGSLAVFLLANNPLSVPRYMLGSYLIAIVVTFIRFDAIRKTLILTAILLGQISVFPLLGELSRGEIQSISDINPIEYYSTHGDFDGYQSTINVVSMVDAQGLKYGKNLLSALLFFVPRSIWADKSVGTGGEAAEYVGYPFINISAPLPSELYVDFGWVGVLVGSFAIGLFVKRLDLIFERKARLKDYFSIAPFAIVAGYLMILMRGSLVGVVGPFAISIVLVLLANRLILSTKQHHKTRTLN